MQLVKAAHTTVSENQAIHNGKVFLATKPGDFSEFAKELYLKSEASYPKFYKMDDLSKLAFLSCELLLSNVVEAKQWNGSEVALVVGNKTGSLSTDLKHYQSYKDRQNYYPSPAVFVYTLANIMLGEICIRHKITGENSCFMMREYDPDFFKMYVHDLFQNEGYRYCITGWIDLSPSGYHSDLFLIKQADTDNDYDVFANFE